MTYSCSDFTDTILDALGIEVPRESWDSPSDQADLCLAAIEKLRGQVMPAVNVHDPVSCIKAALWHARQARGQLRQAGASNAADYVARALKSIEGAERHAKGRRWRDVPEEMP